MAGEARQALMRRAQRRRASGLSATAAVLSLLPVRFLPGGALFAWSRVAWAATLSVALFALVEIMLRPGSRHATNVSLVTAVVLFAFAAAASVSFALYFAVRKRRTAATAVS